MGSSHLINLAGMSGPWHPKTFGLLALGSHLVIMYSKISGLFSLRELVYKSSIIGFTYPICEDVLGGKVLNFRSDARSTEVSAWFAFSVREINLHILLHLHELSNQNFLFL